MRMGHGWFDHSAVSDTSLPDCANNLVAQVVAAKEK